MSDTIDLRAIREAAETGDIHRGMDLLTRETVLRIIAVCEAAQRLLTWTGDVVEDAVAFKNLQQAVRALGEADATRKPIT